VFRNSRARNSKKRLNPSGFSHDIEIMKQTWIILSIFLICLASPLAAETVMIYTADQWSGPEERVGEDYVVFSLEDGLLETLFDAGHIVFNDYAPPLEEQDGTDRNRPALRLARSGGADYLVEIAVAYLPEGEGKASLPDSLDFRLSRVTDSRELATGSLAASGEADLSGDDPREICRDLGRILGNRLLRQIGSF